MNATPPQHVPIGTRARLVIAGVNGSACVAHGLRRAGQRIHHEIQGTDGTITAIDMPLDSARFLIGALESMVKSME